ncbi:MAG: maltotransferase domain-containing protein [Acidimicrobiales bacterium]
MIEDVTPRVAGGRYPAKRVVGEPVTVGATVFADGHDRLHAVVSHHPPQAAGSGAKGWLDVPMISVNPGLDRWEATFTPVAVGHHRYEVRAWVDPFATWRDATRRKLDAGVDTPGDLLAGAQVLEHLAEVAATREAKVLRGAARALADGDASIVADDLAGAELEAVARSALRRTDAASGDTLTVVVEPELALFSAWYERFPRSTVTSEASAAVTASTAVTADPRAQAGRLHDLLDELPAIADLGFDIVYLPPIHPIGSAFRKGPDNTADAGPDDPGSPWAIGGPEGGHTAVHPGLGTVDDLVELADAARAVGLILALDLAFQCSPDHPWVTEHPEWFRHRPDGSIQYAENPPKKYQDIYPLDFESPAWRALWDALLGVTLFWVERGVRVFRVDNPHTKPFPFWEWLIAEVQARHPGTIFLAEAFTRPAVMHRLGQVGFTQGYTYFTWRESKHELIDYFSELASPPSVDEFRPNAWPTTPDILPAHLQHAPLAAFAMRVVLAATLSASYGVLGPSFELGETEPFVLPDGSAREELARSEKYEVRHWHLDGRPTLRPLLADLNRIRRGQLALHTLRTLRFHDVDDDALLCYSKTAHTGPSADPDEPARASMLMVVNLDPHATRSGTVVLDLGALGLDAERPYDVHDLLGGDTYTWSGPRAWVQLDPGRRPAHLFRVTQAPRETAS